MYNSTDTQAMLVPQVLADFEALKRSALAEEDVAQWFGAHVALLDPEHPEVKRPVGVSLNGGSLLLHFSSPERHAHRKFRVTMQRFGNFTIETPLFQALKGSSKINPKAWWNFPIEFEEWSFLVARLGFLVTADKAAHNYNKDVIERAEQFLKEQLPKHFNGMTFEKLALLASSGVLDDTTPATFTNFLFSRRIEVDISLANDTLTTMGLGNIV